MKSTSLPRVPKLVVFDLDGTLIDSRIDLCNSVNATLANFGKPLLEGDTVASYIGNGATALVRGALAHSYAEAGLADPHDDAFVDQATDFFLAWYRIHLLDFTFVYPGVMESLAAIRHAHPHLPMAVLTNKPVGPSVAVCTHFGIDRFCFRILGGNSFASKKPDPEGLLSLAAEAGVSPADTVMVGDSHVDVETAKACGAMSLGCLFGLSPTTLVQANPDALTEAPTDWPKALRLID